MEDTRALVTRIRDGDSLAEDEFVQTFEKDVLRVLRGRMRDHEAAREIADDVLMAVVCALRNGRLQDVAKLRAFVHGTARNLANNFLRARASRPHEEPLPPEAAAPMVPDSLEEGERMDRLFRGLSRLAETDREILLRTMRDGLHPRQIAHDMGLSPEVVRARKSRALHRLIAKTRGDA